jgi:transposase, IS30 family
LGKHLTFEQRCQLAALHALGMTQAAIAAQIGTSQSAVSRELQRNSGGRGYRCQQAQEKAAIRRSAASSATIKMTAHVVTLIEAKLCSDEWSPQQISAWLAKTQQIRVSHERIYQHIWADKRAGGTLFRQLRRSGKRYNKRANKLAGRGIIPGRVDIDQRPAIVEQRIRIGDWEVDTIVGAARQGAILSLVDRVSRYTLLHKLQAATAELTSRAIITKLRRHSSRVHTITADNGKEFALHQHIAMRLGAQFYFAKPYHAWERGLNENTNGLVRQYFPKGSSFAVLTQAALARVQNKLNSRPRKVLGYKSPNEVFFAP